MRNAAQQAGPTAVWADAPRGPARHAATMEARNAYDPSTTMNTTDPRPDPQKHLPDGEDSIPQDPNTDNSWQMEPLDGVHDKPKDDEG